MIPFPFFSCVTARRQDPQNRRTEEQYSLFFPFLAKKQPQVKWKQQFFHGEKDLTTEKYEEYCRICRSQSAYKRKRGKTETAAEV